ncbi:peptidase C11 [Bacteroidia bacterium]|nr:peptidase C11 [Bacteroidia bacterium]
MKVVSGFLTYFLLLGLVLTGCTKIEPIEPPTPQLPPPRTVLAYIAADNSLNSFAYENIQSMLNGAQGNNLNNGNLLVYLDSQTETPKLFQITTLEDGTIGKKIIRTYEERNSASVDVMRSVLDDVFKSGNYKSDSYGLILWSHGTGSLPSNVSGYLRSFGQDKTNFMEVNDLKEALTGYPLDFIIFDACYMASIEVCYALRNTTDYILASPTEVLGSGLPYEHILKYFFTKEPIADALQKIGHAFYTYYEEQQGGASLPKSASTALVKTAGLDQLAAISREILAGKKEAIDALSTGTIQIYEHLGFSNHSLFDLGDFVKQLATADQYNRFISSLDNVVIYKQTTDIAYYNTRETVMVDKERYSGLSVYIPQPQLAPLNDWYMNLEWCKTVFK